MNAGDTTSLYMIPIKSDDVVIRRYEDIDDWRGEIIEPRYRQEYHVIIKLYDEGCNVCSMPNGSCAVDILRVFLRSDPLWVKGAGW